MKAVPESVNVPIELDSENYFRFRSSTRQSVKSKRRFRNREPSRTSLKKILQSLKNKKLRKKLKNTIKKLTPVSSTAYDIAENYKFWNGRYIHQQDSFKLNSVEALLLHIIFPKKIFCCLEMWN